MKKRRPKKLWWVECKTVVIHKCGHTCRYPVAITMVCLKALLATVCDECRRSNKWTLKKSSPEGEKAGD